MIKLLQPPVFVREAFSMPLFGKEMYYLSERQRYSNVTIVTDEIIKVGEKIDYMIDGMEFYGLTPVSCRADYDSGIGSVVYTYECDFDTFKYYDVYREPSKKKFEIELPEDLFD